MARRKNSFSLLWSAVKESRNSMWVSVEVLIVITLFLALILYIAEWAAQAEEFNFWNAITWSFTRYIQDPAQVLTIVPASTTGKVVGSIIGVVGILIFAVPAGILGGAFTSAIENDEREKHLEEIGDQLEKAFKRKQESKTMYKVIPRYISLGTLQAAKGMTEKDIIDAVKHNPNYRLRNLATAETAGTHFHDQLVVEMFPRNTDYGCCIDRKSDITIVCPTGVSEAGIGNFAFYLAYIGGFNYISKEIERNLDEPTSYYIIGDVSNDKLLAHYLEDLRRLSAGEANWTIFLISSESKRENDLHFVTKANSNTGRETTILDNEGFERLWDTVTNELQVETGATADLNELRPVGPKNAAVLIGGGETTNAFTIRVSSEFIVWDSRYMVLAKYLAMYMAMTIGESYGEQMTDPKILKQAGFGYF